MGGGSTIGAAGPLRAGAGGAPEALPAAAGVAGGAARHGRPPRVVSASPAAPSGRSPSCAPSLAERGGGRQRPPLPCFYDDEDGLECSGEEEAAAVEGAAGCGSVERFVFGPVPSREEVVEAVSAIQQMFFPFAFLEDACDRLCSTMEKDMKDKTIIPDATHGVASSDSKSEWIEPSRQLCSVSSTQYPAHEKVIDAFHLLRINPCIQETVFSLSSDKAVWDAIMKNEAVKELRESICAAENGKSPSSDDGHDVLTRLVKWIIECTKVKVIELVNKIAKIVSELLLPCEKGKVGQMDLLEDALRSSFMLSIMVFIVVIITRFDEALR